jgi:hypothetical protein
MDAVKLSQEIFLLPIAEREARIAQALADARAAGFSEAIEMAANVAERYGVSFTSDTVNISRAIRALAPAKTEEPK